VEGFDVEGSTLLGWEGRGACVVCPGGRRACPNDIGARKTVRAPRTKMSQKV